MSLRLGRVDEAIGVWLECLEWHRGQEDLERVADLHRKIGAALSHKGERKPAIEHYQKGINLLKDGPPRIELVRLYEEAAWLYLHTGDNMLAIYASEKALRLAERLGETRAASRAHGIFGRVFGRIGDTEKARQNLERAVELARGSDRSETILALSALGRHLEVSEAKVGAARDAYEEALELAEEMGVLPAQVELHASLAQLAAYGADWDQVEHSTEASAELAEREGLVGKLCLPYTLRGMLRWREGDIGAATVLFHRAHELAEQVGWSELAFQALFGLSIALRDSGDLPGATAALDRGAGRVRARRPDRPVDPGHCRSRRDPRPGPAARGGRGGGAGGRRAGRPPPLPDRPRGGARGARHVRLGSPRRAWSCCTRPPARGPSWTGRWRRRAHGSSPAARWWGWTPPRDAGSSARPPRRWSAWA